MGSILFLATVCLVSQSTAFLSFHGGTRRFVLDDDSDLSHRITDGLLTAECTACKCSGHCIADTFHVLDICRRYGDSITCPDHCASSPCVHGTCHEREDLTTYWCACNDGFTGENCQQAKMDSRGHCVTNPCLHKGTCIMDVNGVAKCICASGFYGAKCEMYSSKYDLCHTITCQNGGSCISDVTKYTCQCLQGYTGRNCESRYGICQSESDCHDNGACAQNNGFFSCRCKQGWIGKYCQEDVNECHFDACKNGASCINTLGNYSCTCQNGWTGHQCDKDLNECNSNICQNGASCTNTPGSYDCNCTSGWTGDRCQIDIDECQSQHCLHGATCQNTQGSYTCSCVSGWDGPACENDIDECSVFHLCHNGAICTNTPGYFSCKCAAGWRGKQCHEDIDECLNNPCLHGSTCSNTRGSYICDCPPGFSGDKCQNGPPANCDHICTLQSAVKATPVSALNAERCPGLSQLSSNEALPMKCCGLYNSTNWMRGQQIMKLCDKGISKLYTPVAAFINGVLEPDTGGIFTGCLSNGERGFMIIRQTCTSAPQVSHVNGTDTRTIDSAPDNYYFVL